MNYFNLNTNKDIFKYLFASLLAASLFLLLSSVISSDDISPDQSTHEDASSTHGASGGRINGLGISSDGSVTFAASEWGGLFKSNDVGLTWSHVDSHVPVATWDVEVSPDDPNKIYATSFYDGKVDSLSGISVSSDGGVTWVNPPSSRPDMDFCPSIASTYSNNFESESTDWTNDSKFDESDDGSIIENQYVWGQGNFAAMGISINPANSDEVYIGTACGLAVTKDAGITWEFIDPPADHVNKIIGQWFGGWKNHPLLKSMHQPTKIWDVVVHDNGIVDVCGEEGHFRKIPNSFSWSTSIDPSLGLPGGICSIAVSPHEPNVLFSVVGTSIYTSIDGGASWFDSPISEPDSQGRIPFIETNEINNRTFDLWYGDVRLYSKSCITPLPTDMNYDDLVDNFRCNDTGINNSIWVDQQAGAHLDAGSILFDPTVSINSCPILYSNDGGVYYNTNSPGVSFGNSATVNCHTPIWDQPFVSPHALWLTGMSGFKNPGDSQNLYFSNQDNGNFVSLNADSDNPDWENVRGADGVSMVGDSNHILGINGVWTGSDPWRIQVYDAETAEPKSLPSTGATGFLNTANYPPGRIVGFKPASPLAQYGINSYALLMTTGLYLTSDITATTTIWTPLGDPSPTDPTTFNDRACGVKVVREEVDIEFNELVNMSVNPKIYNHSFFVQTGNPEYLSRCWGDSLDRVWRYDGRGSGGAWTEILPPGDEVLANGLIKSKKGYGAFSLYDVDPNNPDRIIASHVIPMDENGQVILDEYVIQDFIRGEHGFSYFDIRMVMSEDGGDSWKLLPNLDNMMTGYGNFKYFTGPGGVTKFTRLAPGYFQPSLLAFDPYDENLILAGGADSGVFLSKNSGDNWALLTDPYTPTAEHPHIPRPRFALFDHEPSGKPSGSIDLYIGTQGRGVWRLSPLPDLSVKFLVTKLASQGEDITKKLKLTVSNDGAVEVSDVSIQLYLSLDQSVSERDLLLESITLDSRTMRPIYPSESHNYSKLLRNVEIPSRIKSGDYYICAVVDRANEISEYRENNNASCAPIEVQSSRSRR